jgi:hypothetical protein
LASSFQRGKMGIDIENYVFIPKDG